MKGRLAMLLHAVSVRRGDKWVLRDVSWRLQPGERWALIGDNGAGKTQLLKLLSGAVWPTPGARRRLRGGGPEGRRYITDGRPVELIDAKRRIGAATLDELNAVVYDDVAAERHRWARLTLEAHLIKLAREGLAGEQDGHWRLSRP